jgi:hypothetical protein
VKAHELAPSSLAVCALCSTAEFAIGHRLFDQCAIRTLAASDVHQAEHLSVRYSNIQNV